VFIVHHVPKVIFIPNVRFKTDISRARRIVLYHSWRIIAAVIPRITAEDSPDSFDCSANRPVFADGFNKILAARRREFANIAQK
jgi:hypothetical protein